VVHRAGARHANTDAYAPDGYQYCEWREASERDFHEEEEICHRLDWMGEVVYRVELPPSGTLVSSTDTGWHHPEGTLFPFSTRSPWRPLG